MLWFALAAMTGLAVLIALAPLAFRGPPRPDADSEAGFYKAQLAEIERDVERGQLPAPEAAGARAEAARRLIAASAAEPAIASGGGELARRRIAAAAILLVIPIAAVSAYLYVGRPELPDEPLAARKADPASPEALEAAVAKLEAHLAAAPQDAKGWEVLAPVYLRMGRYEDAAGAFGQLLKLKGESGALRASYGEALIATAGGVVGADARAAMEKALVDTPGLPKARFYLALAVEQDGDTKKALEQYQALLDDSKPGAPWIGAVKTRMAKLRGEAPAEPPAAPAPKVAGAGIQGMSPDQQEMVRGMVERLATRLAQSGGGAEEWQRLIRAYSVLHETDKAKAALGAARTALAKDGPATAQLAALAHDLGLEEGKP
jgi:cytochrome c-type biogenesis protein CcmH